MKKRREKAVLVDRISRWLFPTRLIRYMQIVNGEYAFNAFNFFCQKPKASVVKSLKSPLCELLGKSKGDQNFSMLLNPEEKVVKLFQGSSPRSTAFIFDLCLPISGCFLEFHLLLFQFHPAEHCLLGSLWRPRPLVILYSLLQICCHRLVKTKTLGPRANRRMPCVLFMRALQ